MGDLTGKRIDQTFDGLIKTNDEQPIDGTLKGLQDGVGNNLPVQVSTSTINFTGVVTGDNDTTYDLNTTQDGNNVVLELQPDTGSSVDVNLIPGSGITLTTASNRNIEIAATGGGGGATYTMNVAQDGLNVELQLLEDGIITDTVLLQAGGNVQLNQQGQAVVFSSTDTNTTYDFGAAGAAGNINFALSGSDTSNDVVSMQAGTNITLTDNGSNTFTIDAAGGGGATLFGSLYQNKVTNPNMAGYPSNTFARHIYPIHSSPFPQQVIDQNDDTTVFSRIYLEPGQTINSFIIPIYAGGPATLSIALYNVGPATGQPFQQQTLQTFNVTDTADHWYDAILANPINMSSDDEFWIGVRLDASRPFGMLARDAVGGQTFQTWGGYTGIGGLLPINSLYYGNGVLPPTFTEPYNWSWRDEGLCVFMK